MPSISFEYTYCSLPERFYQRIEPTRFPRPQLVRWNAALGAELGIDQAHWGSDDLARVFSGAVLNPGTQPVAQAYSGHQFGQFNPNLGDGRALLLGEVRDLHGKLRDVHLKGSGATQFSRAGDGRATLSAVIREYLVSEAMHALGVPTSRSLAIILTGEEVWRDRSEPGAILVRVASSHVRVGTFEHFAARNDREALQILADYVIDRHHPDLPKDREGYLGLFERILDRQARLIARWMSLGFIHGVMNTDNTFVSGETLDYGPCAFMEGFKRNAVFSSIDHAGRYAYKNQPQIAQWNLGSLAGCFLSFVPGSESETTTHLEKLLIGFLPRYTGYYQEEMAKKTLVSNSAVTERLLDLMELHQADFTQVFRELGAVVMGESPRSGFWQQPDVVLWTQEWRKQVLTPSMKPEVVRQQLDRANPLFIPRNHLVERAIRAVVDHQNWNPFEELMSVLVAPFSLSVDREELGRPAQPEEQVHETFCNT